jgi:dienelactone hydrolase
MLEGNDASRSTRRWRRVVRVGAVAVLGAAVFAGCTNPGGGGGTPGGGGSGRYRSQVFSAVDKVANVTYSSARGQVGQQSLALDVYKPRGDTVTKRPLIIFAFAGAFAFGSKNNTADPAYAMSQYYAKRGYVTAMINYRLLAAGSICTGVGSSQQCTNAALAGIFDGVSAVRYLRANAAKYGIDPDRIAFGGDSAGGVMAAGASEAGNLPLSQQPANVANTGTPDTSGQIQAFMAVSGGLPDSRYADRDDAPGILFHGTADTIVPLSFANNVKNGLTPLGIDVKVVTFAGAGHVPWQYASQIEAQTTDFFYEHLDLANAAK